MGLERMLRILNDLGNPHLQLPPVIHVAGTNGKGSTVAYMRAILQQAHFSAHIMTSPHLVRFNERFVIADKMIDDDALLSILEETETLNNNQRATFFELVTGAGFLAFSRSKADFCILETGMGGRLDGTNVIDQPLATAITSISFDHMQHLGNSLQQIALEKAGIMKPGVPCVIGPQTGMALREGVMDTFIQHASAMGAELVLWARDWDYTVEDDGTFMLRDKYGVIQLPAPALTGLHQYANAATAAVVMRHLSRSGAIALTDDALGGIAKAVWPARLQRLQDKNLAAMLPKGSELWLDGGHNDHAGSILAEQAEFWQQGSDLSLHLPLHLIVGMINTKDPTGFLKPLLPHVASITTVPIPGHHLSLGAEALADIATKAVLPSAASLKISSADSIEAALRGIANQNSNLTGNQAAGCRVLIAGSLYLAGHVLKLTG